MQPADADKRLWSEGRIEFVSRGRKLIERSELQAGCSDWLCMFSSRFPFTVRIGDVEGANCGCKLRLRVCMFEYGSCKVVSV